MKSFKLLLKTAGPNVEPTLVSPETAHAQQHQMTRYNVAQQSGAQLEGFRVVKFCMTLLPEQGPSPLIFAIAIMIPPYVFWTRMETKWPATAITISDAEETL